MAKWSTHKRKQKKAIKNKWLVDWRAAGWQPVSHRWTSHHLKFQLLKASLPIPSNQGTTLGSRRRRLKLFIKKLWMKRSCKNCALMPPKESSRITFRRNWNIRIAFTRLQSSVIRNLVRFYREQDKDRGLVPGKQGEDQCQLSPMSMNIFTQWTW